MCSWWPVGRGREAPLVPRPIMLPVEASSTSPPSDTRAHSLWNVRFTHTNVT